MKKKTKMRLLSILLCFVMLVGLMPTRAFAWTAPTLSGGKAEWNVQLSDEGVLTWNDMGGTSYDIEVDKTAMGDTLTRIEGIVGTSYNLIDRFKELKVENGTYYFTIKANGTDTTSGTISFSYISPESKLSEPLNLRWDGTVAKWDSVAGATEYSVTLRTKDGYVQLVKTTSATQYDWTTEAADGRWFEVVATGDNYRNSNAAEGPKYGTYSWTAPTLTGGKAEWNVTLSDDGMLRWNDMGSATYDIYVDESAMGGTVTNIYSINTNAYNLINRFKTLNLENGTYYFTIKANDTDTTSGDIRITYVSPETKLSAPLNLRWEGTTAKWDSVANATEYEVRLYSDSGSLQLSKTTSETQYDWTTYAADGYWFEVIATAADYRNSNAAEGPKYIVASYSIGAYPYDATVNKTQAGGQVYLTTDEGTDGWSSDGYIKTATEGSTVTLNAMPATGYKFVEWRQGTSGATISTDANYQFAASENKYLYAVFETISSTSYDIELAIFDSTYTTTDGGTVSIQTNQGSSVAGQSATKSATENTAVTITAVPKQGYEFVAWKVSSPYVSTAFSTEATYTFTVTESVVDTNENPPLLFLYAVFQETQPQATTYEINCVSHNLSSNETAGKIYLETDKGGTGYAASQQKYATENTTVKVKAVAEPGYQFVAWRKGSPTDANATVSTDANYQFTATEAVWMYAVFEYTPDCTIECVPFDITGGINNGQNNVGGTVSIQTDKGTASGTITQSLKATRNSSVTVNAVAASGYEFLGWKKASPYVQDFVATTASYTFDINEELYLYAVFQQASTSEYIVSYDANGGSGTMVGDMVEGNGKFTLENCTYVAPEGYKFKAWAIGSVNGEQKQPGEQITITGETYIYAIWESIAVSNYTITATAGENGNITPSGEVSVAKGSSKTFTITADNGYHIKDVKVNGTSIGAVSAYTFENVLDNATISVEFDVDTVLHTCNPNLVPKVEPNCTTAGKSAYYRCECGKNYEDAQGNTAIADIETWGILNPLNHDYASAWSSDASGHWKICTRCSEKQNVSAHIAGAWIVDKEATETTVGSKHKECTVCGYKVETAEIPKTGKQEETTPVPAAKGKVITDKQGISYKVTKSDAKNGEVTFAKPKSGVKGTVKIPDTVTIAGITYKVTAIEANTFKNNKNITKVIIGNHVTVIGKNAFAGCKKLSSVTVGKKVKKISAGAFSGCAKLKTVKLGAAVTTIGDKAFYKCTSLTNITIPAKVTGIGKSAFEGCKKLKRITVKSTKLKSVGKKALKGIHAKTKIKVPKSKLAKYKRLFKNKGQGKNVKVTK